MKAFILLSTLLFSLNGLCLTNSEVKSIVQEAFDALEGENNVVVTKAQAVKNHTSIFIGMGQVYDLFNTSTDFEFKKVTLQTQVDDFNYQGELIVKNVKTTCTALVGVEKAGTHFVDIRECNKKAFEQADVWDMSTYFEISAATDSRGVWTRD